MTDKPAFSRAVADLARPVSLYVLSFGIAIALETTIVLKLSLVEASALFTPVCLMLGGMYASKSAEEANKSKHEASAAVGVAQAQAGLPSTVAP